MFAICKLTLLQIIFAAICVQAQYYGGGGGGGGGGYEMNNGYGGGQDGDGRPKLHLGLRVRIPAMKFELPRMSLPKITISAKIRQPNTPRTINLPEINLDTSSKVSAPGSQDSEGYSQNGYHNSGGYAAPQQSYSNYGSTNTFSISSGEEETSNGGYNNNYRSRNNNYNGRMQYSASGIEPNRIEANMSPYHFDRSFEPQPPPPRFDQFPANQRAFADQPAISAVGKFQHAHIYTPPPATTPIVSTNEETIEEFARREEENE